MAFQAYNVTLLAQIVFKMIKTDDRIVKEIWISLEAGELSLLSSLLLSSSLLSFIIVITLFFYILHVF